MLSSPLLRCFYNFNASRRLSICLTFIAQGSQSFIPALEYMEGHQQSSMCPPLLSQQSAKSSISIVFIHGLGGHPRNTWSAKNSIAGSGPTDKSPSAETSSTGRKGSKFNKFIKRSVTGTAWDLSDRPMLGAEAASTISVNTTPGRVSTGESIVGPLTDEPKLMVGPIVPPNMNRVFWPQDLLPHDFPNARILTFGFDADLVSLSSTGQRAKLNFTQHAHELLVTLSRELADDV